MASNIHQSIQVSSYSQVQHILYNNSFFVFFFLQSSYHATVPENSPQGTSVIEVKATDSDAGDFGVIRYSLIGERSLDFTIDQKVKT